MQMHKVFELPPSAQRRFVHDVLKEIRKRAWTKKEAELLSDVDAAIELCAEWIYEREAEEKEKAA